VKKVINNPFWSSRATAVFLSRVHLLSGTVHAH